MQALLLRNSFRIVDYCSINGEGVNAYVLYMQGRVIGAGSVTKDPEIDDETPDIVDVPDVNIPELSEASHARGKRTVFDNVVDKLKSMFCFIACIVKGYLSNF